MSSRLRHLPLVDLLVDTTELLELALGSGLKAFAAMLEEDRTASAGRGMRTITLTEDGPRDCRRESQEPDRRWASVVQEALDSSQRGCHE
jgi:hypothetical protein